MRAANIHRPSGIEQGNCRGPLFIAAGITGLLSAACVQGLPVISSMAVLTLGATIVTIERFRGTPTLQFVIRLHLAAYGTLYALFVGGVLHDAATRPEGQLGIVSAADMAASTWLMAIVTVRSWTSLRPHPGRKR